TRCNRDGAGFINETVAAIDANAGQAFAEGLDHLEAARNDLGSALAVHEPAEVKHAAATLEQLQRRRLCHGARNGAACDEKGEAPLPNRPPHWKVSQDMLPGSMSGSGLNLRPLPK